MNDPLWEYICTWLVSYNIEIETDVGPFNFDWCIKAIVPEMCLICYILINAGEIVTLLLDLSKNNAIKWRGHSIY